MCKVVFTGVLKFISILLLQKSKKKNQIAFICNVKIKYVTS